MMLAALCVTVLGGSTPADFFPITGGIKRTYEERGTTNAVTVDEVSAPVQIGGKDFTPVFTSLNGQSMSSTYYQLDNDTLWIAAYDPKKPLKNPVPVFKIPAVGKESKWTYESGDPRNGSALHLAGSAKFGPKRKVFGKEVEVLEVKISATIGAGIAQERVTQNAVYGRGIGLIENLTKTTLGTSSLESLQRLVKVESVGATR